MRHLVLISASIALLFAGAHSAVAQSASTAEADSGSNQEAIALSSRPARTAERPMRLACAPLVGQIYEPNGNALIGATLLVQGTHQVYVTDSEGKFQITETIYQGQVLTVDAAGYTPQQVQLDDCTLPRIVLALDPSARFKQRGKRAGQVIRLNHRSTTLK